MATVHEIEVWLIVNESGEYEVATNEADCGQQFSDNCSTGEAVRKVCLKLKVPVPETATFTAQVPAAEEGQIELTAE